MNPRIRWTLISVSTIWLAVLVTSFFAPDMVSGSQQEHLKIPALVNWVWGALATVSVLRALRSHPTGSDGAWLTVGIGTTLIWVAVTFVSVWGPVVETGSDPTSIPLSAIIAPIAGMLLTRFLVEFAFDVSDSLEKPKKKEEQPTPTPEPPITDEEM
jgi:hypothetical protein